MEEDNQIPVTLRQPEDYVIPLVPRTKRPAEQNWPNSRYWFNDEVIINHLSNGGNVGFLTGISLVMVLDIDDDSVSQLVNHYNTFVVKTGSGKVHIYFRITDASDEELRSTILKDRNGKRIGDIRGIGAQVAIPPSIHPNGNRYTELNNNPIREITISRFKEIIKEIANINTTQSTSIEENNEPIPVTRVSRSEMEFRKIIELIKEGKGKEEIYAFMTENYEKWNERDERSRNAYRNNTYENALRSVEEGKKPTPLKNIKVNPGDEIRAKSSILDMTSGISIITGYNAFCPVCRGQKIVHTKSKLTCHDLFREEIESGERNGCLNEKGRPVAVDFEPIYETGYMISVYDPEDSGNNMLIVPIFIRNNIIPEAYQAKKDWEGDLLIKSIILDSHIKVFPQTKKIVDWYLYVDKYEFEIKEEEIDFKLLRRFGNIKRDKEFFEQNFIQDLYERILAKKTNALVLLSPLKVLLPNGKVEWGIINSIEIGDPGQSKTYLAKQNLKYTKGTNSRFVSVENSNNRGLLGSVVRNQNSDSWTVKVGDIPKASNAMIYLDGYSKLSPEDMTQFRGILEEKIFQISKAGGIEKECPVRIIMLGNVVKPISQYETKHQASFDMGSTESDYSNKFSGPDRRRLHHILVVADADTDAKKVDAHILKRRPVEMKDIEKYWSNLRAFAWSRKPDDFIWEENILEHVQSLVNSLRDKYSSFSMLYGILSKGGSKMFAIQLASVAILHESFDEKNKVVIKKEHADWLYNLYIDEFTDLGLDVENELKNRYKAHVIAISRKCPLEVKNMLHLMYKYGGNQSSIERAKITNRMQINRILNQIIEYELEYASGTKKHWYKLNEGSGENREFTKGNFMFFSDNDLPAITKKGSSSLTDFGRMLVKEISNMKDSKVFEDKIIGIPGVDVTTVTGVTPLEEKSDKKLKEIIQSNTKEIENKKKEVCDTNNPVTDVTPVTKGIIELNNISTEGVTDVTPVTNEEEPPLFEEDNS